MPNTGRTAIVTYSATFTAALDIPEDVLVSDAIRKLTPGTGEYIPNSMSIIRIVGPVQPTVGSEVEHE